MNVKDSVLYRTLQRQVRKQDHAELLRMLELVPKKAFHGFSGFDQPQLVSAFLWHRTPQGLEYWLELSDRMRIAGHPHY